jgi:hypothetical protein
MFQIFAAVACDQLWFLRNKAHYDNLVPNALVISANINKIALEHHSAWSTSLIRNPKVWKKPSSPFYKINYDTAIRLSFLAQAAVIRNSSGAIIKCSSIIRSPNITLFGEARAAFISCSSGSFSTDYFFYFMRGFSYNYIGASKSSYHSRLAYCFYHLAHPFHYSSHN